MKRILKLLPCVLVLSVIATSVQAGMTGGQFVLDGKAFSPQRVAAFHTQRWADKGKYLTMVLLTVKDVDVVKIGSTPYAYDAAINDPTVKGSDYIVLWVEQGGQVNINASIGNQQFIDTSGMMAGQPGNLVVNCTDNKPEFVQCEVKTAHEVKTLSGHTYTVDVVFGEKVLSGKP